jgi:hypothetical protein
VAYKDIVLEDSTATYESGVDIVASGDLSLTASSLAPYWGDPAVSYPVKSIAVKCDRLLITAEKSDRQDSSLEGNLKIQAGHVELDKNGVISADGYGYPAKQGPGCTLSDSSIGASYGGRGGNKGAATYGSASAPTGFGSGSYDAVGGGAIRLDVPGTLTLNGIVSSNGLKGESGSSGGSVYVTAGTLAGSGSISAAGGSGSRAGGGGGRVAVYYSAGTFTGTGTASGGTGSASSYNGEDGTVLFNAAGEGEGEGEGDSPQPASGCLGGTVLNQPLSGNPPSGLHVDALLLLSVVFILLLPRRESVRLKVR